MKSLILTLFLVSPMAYAEIMPPVSVDQAVCYGREYSSAHMEKSSKQTVKRMDIKFYREPDFPETILMKLNVDVKKESGYRDSNHGGKEYYVYTRPYHNTFACSVYDGKFNCSIDCDGGSVSFDGQFGSTVKLVSNGFTVQGGCGEEEESIFLEAIKGGDDYFTLHALPAEFCQR